MPVVIPPWIDVNPKDFVQAASSGARIGAEIAGHRNEAAIAAGRNQTALEEAQMHINAAAAAQQAESQRAESERALREWELRQQILHQATQIDAENQRNQNTIAGANQRALGSLGLRQQEIDAANQRAAAALDERQKYGNSTLDIRREANRIAQERADAAKNKPATGDYTTVSEHTKEVPDTKRYSVNEPEIFNLFSKNTPGKSFDTTNAVDLQNLPRGTAITTNTIPNTGIPARTISRRIPIGQDPYALPSSSAPVSPMEGKRVRDKVTGAIGIISNGQFIPDQADENLDGDAASM